MAARDASDFQDAGYGEQSRFAAHLDRGWALLDRGEVGAARTSATHAHDLRPEDPDASVLTGAIALAEGNAAECLSCYEKALELDPDYLEPYAAAAQVCLFDLEDPARALRFCTDALELDGLSAFEVLDLELMAVECELALGEIDAGRERLQARAARDPLEAVLELAAGGEDPSTKLDAPDARLAIAAEFLCLDPEGDQLDEEERADRVSRAMQLSVRLGRLRIDLGEVDAGLSQLRRLVELFPQDPDAWYLSSEAEHRHGDPRRAAAAGLNTLELDRAAPEPKWLPSPALIHRRVIQAIRGAPDEALSDLAAGDVAFAVLVDDAPPRELVLEGVDPRVGALALASKSPGEEVKLSLTGIAVYRRNIARFARDAEQFEQELRHCILDELAAFLGLPEKRRQALGLPKPPPTVEPPPPPPEEAKPEPKPRKRGRRRSRTLN